MPRMISAPLPSLAPLTSRAMAPADTAPAANRRDQRVPSATGHANARNARHGHGRYGRDRGRERARDHHANDRDEHQNVSADGAHDLHDHDLHDRASHDRGTLRPTPAPMRGPAGEPATPG